jgi:hypothetical protein
MKRTYRFVVEVNMTDDLKDVTCSIGSEANNPPTAAVVVAAEHMMTAAAMQGLDFETALKSLCDGARSNKVKMFEGKRADQ